MEKKKLPDTPWHLGYTKKEENDPRRHKARCVYLQDGVCHCEYDGCYMQKCGGSAHCMHYSEESKEKVEERIKDNEVEMAVRDNFAHAKKSIRIEIVCYKGKKYYKIYLSEYESIMIPYKPKISKEEIMSIIKEYYESKGK